MDKVIQIANICKDMCNVPNPIPGRIYYAKGCAPALNTCVGGGVEKTNVFMDKAKVTTPPDCATHSDGATTATGPRMCMDVSTAQADFTSIRILTASPRYRCQTEDNG